MKLSLKLLLKETIQCVTLGIPKGTEKMQFLFLLLFALTFYNFRGKQSKKLFEIILHIGLVTSLQSWKGNQK